MWYVPVIDYETGSLDSLRPFDNSPDELIQDMNWTYDGKMMFYGQSLGWITIDQGQKSPGGTWGVQLVDGRNYGARLVNGDTVEVYSTIEPDVEGHGTDLDTTIMNIGLEDVNDVRVLNSMEPNHLYLQVWRYIDFAVFEVWIFDLNYSLIDKITPPQEDSYYYTASPDPFITANGDIYEFRARDDGLHVIKWTKQ
jgi:hypothetical protein